MKQCHGSAAHGTAVEAILPIPYQEVESSRQTIVTSSLLGSSLGMRLAKCTTNYISTILLPVKLTIGDLIAYTLYSVIPLSGNIALLSTANKLAVPSSAGQAEPLPPTVSPQ